MRGGLSAASAALAGLLALAYPAAGAAGTSGAPYSGLEGGPRHAFGPDSEGNGKADRRAPIPTDAYVNPITGEGAASAPRERPGAGAYGGYGRRPGASRPLPSVEGPAKWHFR